MAVFHAFWPRTPGQISSTPWRSVQRVVPPERDPIDWAEIKAQMRLDSLEEAELVAGYIKSATDYVEEHTGRALITQTWEVTVDNFPSTYLELPRPPLQSIASITYLDDAGATQTVASTVYRVQSAPYFGVITLASGQTWPVPQTTQAAVTVRYVAGYGTEPRHVPASIRQAIRMLAAHWHEHREATIAGVNSQAVQWSVDDVLLPYRVVVPFA